MRYRQSGAAFAACCHAPSIRRLINIPIISLFSIVLFSCSAQASLLSPPKQKTVEQCRKEVARGGSNAHLHYLINKCISASQSSSKK